MLGVDGATNSKGRVELYERGYGKDAAGIAKEAIAYAKDSGIDVVLIDTAGRMQDNEVRSRSRWLSQRLAGPACSRSQLT